VDNKIVVSLPVKSVSKSVEFFRKLGFTFDAQLTDEKAPCMILGEGIFVMLVTEDELAAFSPRRIYDTARCAQAQLSIT
jgi:uncharacterized protein